MSESQIIYLLAFIAYLLAMVVISWLVSRWQRSSDDFLLAGRRVPLLLTLGTTVATMVGTGSSMGAVGFAYQHAWAGALYGIGGALGILILAWLFAPARTQAFSTMSEELASYVGNKAVVKKLLAVLIYAASIGWLGAHLIGGGMYLSWLTGLDESSAKLLIGIGLAIYVSLGGYSAIVWTDSIQAIILFVGFLLMAYFAVDVIGGWQALGNNHIAANNGLLSYQSVGLLPAFSMSLAILVGVLATPSFRQRIYSAHSVKSIRVSFVISGGLYLGFSLIPAVIGICAYLLNDQLDNPAFAFPYIAINTLPVAVGGFILLAGISATLSSASSDAIAGVSVLVSDIYKWLVQADIAPEKQLFASRLAMLVTVFIALGLALLSNNIIGYITKMVSVVLAGLCIMGLLGRFWSGYTWQGSLATLAGGSLGAVIVSTHSSWLSYFGNPIIPALLSALMLGIVVSLLSKSSQDDTTQQQVVS
ncbi:sodium:solute symporter family protein [Pseudoalteromonas sp. S16_S37]|uniref:sodium:solute symporter family protein n=1 Tax=Pseudoalteromonas sp. S16_S37 TaxID=2720228 RepID=UPI001680344F|nr:sodium:solute symporter family protein [Pseudoalteromonas sp. S16_S37]MBD1582904.1 sodium:solute symporter family protein [Pseudoalteromonas sp. S16_S37]